MKYSCVNCKSNNTTNYGIVDNDAEQIECKDCGCKFTIKELADKHNNPNPKRSQYNEGNLYFNRDRMQ